MYERLIWGWGIQMCIVPLFLPSYTCIHSDLVEILNDLVTATFTRAQCTYKHNVKKKKSLAFGKKKNTFFSQSVGKYTDARRTKRIASGSFQSFPDRRLNLIYLFDFIIRNLWNSYYSITVSMVFAVLLGFSLNSSESTAPFWLRNEVLSSLWLQGIWSLSWAVKFYHHRTSYDSLYFHW